MAWNITNGGAVERGRMLALIREGLAEWCLHPTVKGRLSGTPLEAVRITDLGRKALMDRKL
jgi:hypothetical protein